MILCCTCNGKIQSHQLEKSINTTFRATPKYRVSPQPESQQNEGFYILQKIMAMLVEQMSTMNSLVTTVITKLVK